MKNKLTNQNQKYLEGINIARIKKKAEELNKRYNRDTVPPIFSEKIVQAEGLFISYKKFSDSHIASLERDTKTIYLTTDKNLLEKWGNFAIAHELGHWFFDDRAIDYFDPSTIHNEKCDIEDKEANYFASYLLMPDDLYNEWGWLDPQVFVSAFRIPQEGIELRKSL